MIVVGLTADEAARPGEEGGPLYQLKAAYAEAVLAAGGLPWILPYADDPAVVDALLDRLDALVVTGGAFDVPPELYGEAARPGLGALKPGRTRFEWALTAGALARGLPLLGVCGGMQLLNVVRGGTLHQDLGRDVPGAADHEQRHDRRQPAHPVRLTPGSRLAAAFGGAAGLQVNSTHHQAVARPGRGLELTAVAPDGVIEAVEDPGAAFVMGVQWHPEVLALADPAHLSPYRALVAAARGGRRG